MHQKHSQNIRYHIHECLHTPGTVHTKELGTLHNEMIMLPEDNLSNGPLFALTLSSKHTLHREVVALEMPTVPESDPNVNPA